jgi:pimeloyl-ACP methyl ester carboxylesterase
MDPRTSGWLPFITMGNSATKPTRHCAEAAPAPSATATANKAAAVRRPANLDMVLPLNPALNSPRPGRRKPDAMSLPRGEFMLHCSNFRRIDVFCRGRGFPTMKTTLKTAGVAALAGTGALALGGLLASRAMNKAVAKRSPAPGRMLSVDGVELHVQQQGAGPDVLLIHGAAMMGSEMLLALGEALSGYRLTAIDRPGHGWSDKTRRPSIFEQARLFHAAAAQLGLRQPTVVGHSQGGAVALAYGERFADDISGVVAVAPLAYPAWGAAHLGRALRGAPVLGPLLSNTTLAAADPAGLRAVLPLIFAPQKPTDAFKAAIDVDVLTRPWAMVADGADFTKGSMELQGMKGRYAGYPAALHVVLGTKDRILKPSRQGEKLAGAVPEARLTTVEGKGHMVHHFAPEVVAAAVTEVRERGLLAEAPALAA